MKLPVEIIEVTKESPVGTMPTYCGCGNDGFHSKVRVLAPDLEFTLETPRVFIVSDNCPHGPAASDAPVEEGPGYKLFYRAD